MSYDDFLQLLKTRRSIRRFKPDPIPDEYVAKIVEAARWSMSGANGQPWEFIAVKDPAVRQKILDAYMSKEEFTYEMELTRVEELRHPGATSRKKSPEFKDAPVIIVVAGDPRKYIATVICSHFLAGEGWLTFFQNMGNATQNVHLAAASLGLGAQWVSVNPLWEPRVRAAVDLPDILRIFTIVPIGYPAYKPAPSYRREASELLHWDRFDKSRYLTTAQVREYIASLRKRTTPTYRV